jgi:uncharacterized protein YjbJ (UPF0337 family)
MNKHQVTGRTNQAKGKVKEVTGKVTGNERMEAEGTVQKLGGKTEAAYGDLKNDIKKAVK